MKALVYNIKDILTWIFVFISMGMMVFTIISVNTFDKADRDLFGYKAFIVLSDSMSKSDINSGDLIIIKETDPSTLKEGDIISYTSTSLENYGETITHKIRSLTTDENGNLGFITYGTTTDTDDENIVTYERVLGKYENCIPKVGKFFNFLKTTPGYFYCILIPFMVLILMQAIDSINLFRKYKEEQKAELQAQRDEIAREKAESKRMIEELMKLKEELGATN